MPTFSEEEDEFSPLAASHDETRLHTESDSPVDFPAFGGGPELEMPDEDEHVASQPPRSARQRAPMARRSNDSGTSGKGRVKAFALPIIGLCAVGLLIYVMLPTIESHLGIGQSINTANSFAPKQDLNNPSELNQGLHIPGADSGTATSASQGMAASNTPTGITVPTGLQPDTQQGPAASPVGLSSPEVTPPSGIVAPAQASVLNQLTSLQQDVDTSFTQVNQALTALASSSRHQAQQISDLQMNVANLSTSVQKLIVAQAAAPAPQPVAQAPAKKTMADSALAHLHVPSHEKYTAVLKAWHLRGISQTSAAFATPDGQLIYTPMGRDISGLSGKLVKLIPYNGSWEAITTKGIIRP